MSDQKPDKKDQSVVTLTRKVDSNQKASDEVRGSSLQRIKSWVGWLLAHPAWTGISGVVGLAALAITVFALMSDSATEEPATELSNGPGVPDETIQRTIVVDKQANPITENEQGYPLKGQDGSLLPESCNGSAEITNAHLNQAYSPPEQERVWVYYEPGRRQELNGLLQNLTSEFPKLNFPSREIAPNSGLCSGCLAIYYRDMVEKGLVARLCALLSEEYHRPTAASERPVVMQNVLAGRNLGNTRPFSIWIAD